MTGKTGEPDNLALVGNEFDAISLGRGACPNADRGRPARHGGFRHRSHFARCGATHSCHQLIAVEAGSAIGCDNHPVAHNYDAIGICEDFAEEVRDQHATCTHSDHSPHMGEQLPGRMAVKRRSRFVKDDEMERILCDRERACHFDHLAFTDRQVSDDSIGSNAVVREDLVELVAD